MTGALSGALLGPWSVFFATVAEAAATFAGLVIVAISVNLQRILAARHLPARAFSTLGALVIVLVMSLAALIPQPTSALALEIALAAVLSWLLHLRTQRLTFRSHAEIGRPRHERVLMVLFGQAQLLPMSAGAILLEMGHPAGLYWIAGTMTAALVVSMINTWILLVEIVR